MKIKRVCVINSQNDIFVLNLKYNILKIKYLYYFDIHFMGSICIVLDVKILSCREYPISFFKFLKSIFSILAKKEWGI